MASRKTRSKSATTGEIESAAPSSLGSRRLSASVLRSGKTFIPRPVGSSVTEPSSEATTVPLPSNPESCVSLSPPAVTQQLSLPVTPSATNFPSVTSPDTPYTPSVGRHSQPNTPITPLLPAVSVSPITSVPPVTPVPPAVPVPSASVPRTPESSDSDSSSDDDMGNAIVLCEGIEIPKVLGLPRVTASVLNPYILRELEDYVEVYLEDKGIDDEKRCLKKIAGCFANSEHMKWVNTEAGKQPMGTTLTMFMDKIRKRFLPDNWELEVQNDRQSDVMKRNDKFVDWATRIKKKNSVLIDTAFYLDDSALRMFLQSHLCEDLMRLVFETPTGSGSYVYTMTDIAKWENEVQRLDNFRRRQQKAIRDALQEAERSRNNSNKTASSSTATATGSSKPRRAEKQTSTVTSSDHCPTLTNEERRILIKYDGCFKCRKVLQTHISLDCTAPFPKGEGYCPVQKPTQAEIDAFNAKKESGSDKRGSSSSSSADRPAKKQKKDAAAGIVPADKAADNGSGDDSDAVGYFGDEGDTTDSD